MRINRTRLARQGLATMFAILTQVLLRGEGRLLCVVSVIAVFLLLGLAKRTQRKCPRCHTLNRPPARFCAQCGVKLTGS